MREDNYLSDSSCLPGLEAYFITTSCLVAAMNPCPCGYYGDVYRTCTCGPSAVQKYLKRISGPLLDRIDIHIEVPRLSEEELLQLRSGESSAAIRERVCQARARQAARFAVPAPAEEKQTPSPANPEVV